MIPVKIRLMILLGPLLLAALPGCNQQDSAGYVEFRKTEPVTPDNKTETANQAPGDVTSPAETVATPPSPAETPTTTSPDAPSATTETVDGSGTKSTTADGTPVTADAGNPQTTSPSAEQPGSADAQMNARTVTSEQSGLTGPADQPTVDNAVATETREVKLLIPEKRFRRERPGNSLRVGYDDIDLLKVLNMEPVPPNAPDFFPAWLKELDGKTIRIRGFMYPTFVATGLTEFVLARDNGICCFVRQPKVYDIIGVVMAEGETTDYIANRPFDVEGIFRIDPQADDKDLSRLYRIEQAKVLN